MVGIVVLAAAALISAYAISTYEAWWTVVLVVFGVITRAVERSALRGRSRVLVALGLIGSIVVAGAGGWMVLLGVFPAARPCDTACFDNSILLLPGLVTVMFALVVGAMSLRTLARGFSG
jgi:hypothetical protein